MYGVIVCPRCKRAKGVDLKQKTTTCACGFEIRIAPSRVRARADTARELASLVGQVSAELAGGLAAYRKAAAPARRRRSRDVHLRIVGVASKPHDRAGRLRAAAVELTRELGLLPRRLDTGSGGPGGIADAEGALATLIRANLVMEPKDGFYRAVSLSP